MNNTIDLNNKEDRQKLRKNPHQFMPYINKNIDVRVVTNTKNKIFIVTSKVNNTSINAINAGVAASTVSTGACIGTFSTAACPITSAGTVGSYSTIGTVDV